MACCCNSGDESYLFKVGGNPWCIKRSTWKIYAFFADIGGTRLDGIISDVQKVMMKLVTGNADAWAPIISAVRIRSCVSCTLKYMSRQYLCMFKSSVMVNVLESYTIL